MADTQHNLRIKATLDTSQLQQEIERLNGQKYSGGGGGASGAARSTSSLLSKLDSTLNRLNSTMQQMNQLMQRHGNASSSAQMPLLYPIGMQPFSFARPGSRQTAVRPAAVHPDVRVEQPKPPSPPQMAKLRWGPAAGPLHQQLAPGGLMKSQSDISQLITNMTNARAGMEGRGPVAIPPAGRKWIDRIGQYFSYQQHELEMLWKMGHESPLFADLDALEWLSNLQPTGNMVRGKGLGKSSFRKFPKGFSEEIEKYIQARSNFNAASKPRSSRPANPLNPPIVSENVMHVFPDGTFQLLPRDAPATSTQPTSSPTVRRRIPHSFRQQLRAFGIGTATSFAAGQLSQWGEASDSTGLSLAGSVLGGAGAGAMTGAFFGPWGAAIGAAFGAVSQGALELVKSFKQLDEAARSRVLLSERAAASAAGGLEGIRAQRVVLGPEADRMLEVSQLELKTLEKSRENLLLRQQKLAAGEITDQTAEQIKRTAEDLSTTEAEISAKKSVIETLKSRKEALDEEVLAGHRLAEAEREFSKSIEDAEYRQRREWSEYNTSNIQANREALRSYRQQLASARSSQMMAVFNTGIESQLGQIRTNSFNGNKDPVYWFKLAKEQRNYIGQFQQAALGTGDLQKMSEYMRKAAEASQKFQGFMQMAQVLKIMQIGQPVNRVDLQGLTSLAGRGGWMGEQYRQPEYMSTLDKMYDTLKSIDDNTRAAEKSVWQ